MVIDVSDPVKPKACCPILVTELGIFIDVSTELLKAAKPKLVTPVGITTAPVQRDPSDTTPLEIVYVGDPSSLIPEEHLYNPSAGTAADAVGLPVVRTDAANKKGNTTLNNFEVENIAISPSYDDR